MRDFAELRRCSIPPDKALRPELFGEFSGIPGLSNEIIEKLSVTKPLNLGQASRISGMTPVAISILMVRLRTWGKSQKQEHVGQV